MPRPRGKVLFEICGYWIAERPGRPGLYYFWNDPGTGRTCRRTLGTSDFGEAQQRLAEIVVRQAPATVDTFLATLLENYFLARTDHLPSKKPARHAGKLLLMCWGAKTKASAINHPRIKAFVDWCLDRGNSIPYIARNLSVLSAAMAHAKLVRDIPIKEGAIIDRWPDVATRGKARRKVYEPTDAELGRLLAQAMPESLRRWLLNSMATLARPMAVASLHPSRRDRLHGLIDLNPAGRRQNKKFRPILKEPRAMTRWLDRYEKPKGLAAMDQAAPYAPYGNRSSIHTALRRACAKDKANIPRMALYSIRHRGTTILRNAKVPKDQIDYQLGHVQSGARSTQDYGQFEPDYLADATRALDAWIARVISVSKETKIRKAA